MKFHPIFYMPYQVWWLILAVVCIAKFAIFGFPIMHESKGYGYIFWVLATLFTGLIFGSIIYLIYRLFSGKWNNKIFMILVSVMTILVLFTYK